MALGTGYFLWTQSYENLRAMLIKLYVMGVWSCPWCLCFFSGSYQVMICAFLWSVRRFWCFHIGCVLGGRLRISLLNWRPRNRTCDYSWFGSSEMTEGGAGGGYGGWVFGLVEFSFFWGFVLFGDDIVD